MSASARTLGDLLQSEAREAAAFIELLKKEQALLVAGDVDGLLPLIDQKSRYTDKLGDLARAREAIIAEARAGSGRSGMETYLARQPDEGLRARWQTLLAAATEVQAMNETNGKLIRLHLQHNQKALAMLMEAANRATTYGPDGQQRPGGSGRFLGSA